MVQRAALPGLCVVTLVIYMSCHALISKAFAAEPLDFHPNANAIYRGEHRLTLQTDDEDGSPLIAKLDSYNDFETFILLTSLQVKPQGTVNHWIARLALDWDGDGYHEQELPLGPPVQVSHTYPPPTNGISESHTVGVWIYLMDSGGRGMAKQCTFTITIYARPRIFANANGDVFVQPRDEDCSDKIPLLLVEGIDVLNLTFPTLIYTQLNGLINTEFRARGIETFILNFKNGGADLRTNAEVVNAALAAIHELCPNNKIAVIGFSMGGLVCRYALAKQEAEELDHHVGLFISYDSPQQIAHANHVLQTIVKAITVDNELIAALKAVFQSQAAKQLLEYDAYDPGPPEGPTTQHIQFFNELYGLKPGGYPENCFKGAVSNGAMVPTYDRSLVDQPLLNYSIHVGDDVPFSIEADLSLRDVGPGCTYPNFAIIKYGEIPVGSPANWFSQVIQAFMGAKGIYWEVHAERNPAFIPTQSALDLVNPQMVDQAAPITGWDSSHFDAIAYQQTSLPHVAPSAVGAASVLGWFGQVFPVKVAASGVSLSSLYPGQLSECKVSHVGGIGSYTYNWEYRNIGYSPGDLPWTHFSSDPTPSVSVSGWYDRQVRVTISDGVSSACDTLPCIANLNSHAYPTVAVAGWSVLPAGSNGTWTANAWEGRKCGDFAAREWRIRPHGTSTWSSVIGTGQTLMWPTYSSTATDLQVKVQGEQWGTGELTVWHSPAAVTDLAQEVMAPHEIWMTWTAPGNPGLTAPAIAYDVRVSETPINSDVSFYAAPSVECGAPGDAGQWEELIIPNLMCNHYYYIAIKVQDVSLAWSPISNVVHARTIGGALCQDPGLVAGGGTMGSFGSAVADEQAAAAANATTAEFSMEWQPNLSGGTLAITVSAGSDTATDGVLTRTAPTGSDSTADVGLSSGEWTTLGLALRAREEKLTLGSGWRPFGLPVSVVAADGGNHLYAVESVSRTRGGSVEVLEPVTWDGAFGQLVAGDELRIEYAKTDSVAADSTVSAWILLTGPAGSDPLFGRTPEPTKVGEKAPERLELRILSSRESGSPVRFEIGLARPGLARLEVLDVSGRRVCELVNEWRPEGRHALTWAGRDGAGRQVGAGVYFCRLTSGGEQRAAKVLWGGMR